MIYISISWRKCFVPQICMWPRVRWILPFHLYVTRGRWFSHQNWAKIVSMLYVQFLHFWIVMDTNGKGDRENTKNICKLFKEISPVVSQVGNCGVFKAENIIADCLALLGFSVWWPQVSTTMAGWKYFWRWLWNRFAEPAQKRLRLRERSQGRVRGSRLFLQYSFYALFDPFQRHWCVQLTKFSLYEQCPIENCSKGCYNEIISTSVPGGYDLLHDTCRVK